MAKPSTENRPTSSVYISRSDGRYLRQTYPERKPLESEFDEYLPSREASQIRNDADVTCVYGGDGYSGKQKDGSRFSLSVKDWDVYIGSDEYEERFAKEVEEMLGRKNLILIRY